MDVLYKITFFGNAIDPCLGTDYNFDISQGGIAEISAPIFGAVLCFR